jgi:hypothetical protein
MDLQAATHALIEHCKATNCDTRVLACVTDALMGCYETYVAMNNDKLIDGKTGRNLSYSPWGGEHGEWYGREKNWKHKFLVFESAVDAFAWLANRTPEPIEAYAKYYETDQRLQAERVEGMESANSVEVEVLQLLSANP